MNVYGVVLIELERIDEVGPIPTGVRVRVHLGDRVPTLAELEQIAARVWGSSEVEVVGGNRHAIWLTTQHLRDFAARVA